MMSTETSSEWLLRRKAELAAKDPNTKDKTRLAYRVQGGGCQGHKQWSRKGGNPSGAKEDKWDK